jgi:hypothetical protein
MGCSPREVTREGDPDLLHCSLLTAVVALLSDASPRENVGDITGLAGILSKSLQL